MARRRQHTRIDPEHAREEGPFVSFTDLFIGILFLFLILVAALMLMHQEAVELARLEVQRLEAKIRELQAELDRSTRLDATHPPFRLAIAYNSYQKAAGAKSEWIYSRTVQIYRAPNGLCLENVIMRNNLSLAWKPAIKPEDIPSAKNPTFARMGTPCALSRSGESWKSEAETGGVKRVAPNLYSGTATLHQKDSDRTVEIQYRVLGIYDDFYR